METIYRLYKDVGDNQSDIFDAVMRNDCTYIIKYYEDGFDINITDKNENLVHKPGIIIMRLSIYYCN